MNFGISNIKKILGEKKRTVKPWTLWDVILSEYFTKNKSEVGPTRPTNFYADTNALYSGEKNITYVYLVDQFPSQLELSFRKTIRRECKTGVRISFVTNLNRDNINWDSPANKNRFQTWKNLEKANSKEVSVYEMAGELNQMDAQNYKKASLWYLMNADLRRRRKLFNVQGIMLVTGHRGNAFDDTVNSVEKVCKKGKIKIKRITGNISDYLETFSPFSLRLNNSIIKRSGSNVLTDEIVARLNSYEQGTVGTGSMYWGSDIYSKKPVLKEPKAIDTDAENWLIVAETGGGKSYLVKTYALQLLGRSDVVGTINDIEGDEYTDLGYIIANEDKVVMLDIGDAGGRYFDPVEIYKTGDPKLDKDMYALSYSFTTSMFKTLVGERVLSKRDWADTIIKSGVQKFYSEIKVDRYDSSTWVNSKEKTIFDVFEEIKKFEPDTPNEEFYADKELVISALDSVLGIKDRKNGRFGKKVSFDSIKDAKLVINSFGMKGRSEQTVDPVDMALMQLYTALISHLRSIFAKARGMYNFKIWEEFQRWGGFPGAEETLKTPLSGGRKLGDINIIVTNRPSELLDADRFKIFDSITSFAIGAVGDSKVRQELCERLEMPLMKRELDLIEMNRKSSEDNTTAYEGFDAIKMNPYAKAFLIGLERREFSIAKIVLPDSLSNTALFQTGVKTQQ
ncbi:hypothetical protein COF68_05915 [Bacillus toyonensis]|uniref:hypothetical protein n=1 Tax=Bacillus toyonensis TaxID=155322 RepID=UPI000BFC9D1F|nr:hypothetical protein [Bacillus toyonensis]PHE64372.1 hypothetical protein COF68_05915 [Bacillus toyonensis]